MLKYLFTCCLLFNIYQYVVSQDIIKVEINPEMLQLGECKLNDLAESVEYIPLETTNECMIGKIKYFDISENYIVVYCSKSDLVYLFHRDGRFISPVGNKGYDTGEYLSPDGVFINEKKGRIIVICSYSHQHLNYDLNGKYIDAVLMDEKTANGLFRRFYDEQYLITTKNYHGNEPFAYEIRGTDLKLITEKVKTVYYETGSVINVISGPPNHYLYKDLIHVKELSLNDTIYSIEKNYFFKPKYVVNAGKYEVTTDLKAEKDGNTFLKRAKEYVCFRQFYETKDKLFILYDYQDKNHYCYFDLNTRKLLYFSSERGIPNDYDGGMDFWPQRQDNRFWYTFYDVKYFEKEFSNNNTPQGDPKAIQTYNKLMENIDLYKNPILVIVKIKE